MLKKTLTWLLTLAMLLSMCTVALAAEDTAAGYDVRVKSASGNRLLVEVYTEAGAALKNGRFTLSYPEEVTVVSAESKLTSGTEQVADLDTSKKGTVSFAWATVSAQSETLLLSITVQGPYDTTVNATFTDQETGSSTQVALTFPQEIIVVPGGGDNGGGNNGGSTTPEQPFRFKDVQDSNLWYYNAVYAAYDAGLMNGVGNDLFAPNEKLTRASLIVTLYRMAGSPAVSGTVSYKDVPQDAWYKNAVIWGTQNGIINGLADGRFAPGGFVTREQVAAMLYRYWKFNGGSAAVDTSVLNGFADRASVGNFAVEALSWAVGAKVINGSTGASPVLNPKGTATRAQIAQILVNYLNYSKA